MTRKNKINLCTYLLFSLVITGNAFADLTSNNYKFSNLFQKSDVIVVGYVTNVTTSSSEYRSTFVTESKIKGSMNVDNIEINVPLAKWLHLPTEYYMVQGAKYLVFLESNNRSFTIVNHAAGVMNVESSSDVELLFTVYKNNKNLFAKSSLAELKTIFSKITLLDTKYRLLLDFIINLSDQDEQFLRKLLESRYSEIRNFSIQQIGRQNVIALNSEIIGLLENSSDLSMQLHCLVALGDMQDSKSVDLIISYLNHSEQGIRLAAIQALGKIGTIEVIGSLKLLYASENDVGNRISIITALERNPNKAESIKALKELQDVLATPLVSSILKKRLSKLE